MIYIITLQLLVILYLCIEVILKDNEIDNLRGYIKRKERESGNDKFWGWEI